MSLAKKKHSMKIGAVTALILAFLFAISTLTPRSSRDVIIESSSGAVRVDAEVADTEIKRSVGLMNRKYLPENSGMLFIFGQEGQPNFWMKNTLIPLDLIFISTDFTIVDIKENFQPCTANPCPQYSPQSSAQYVLEVNAGFVKSHGITNGQKVAL